MDDDRAALLERLVDICHRLSARGFVTATDGNVSVRLPGGTILASRSEVNKGMVTARDFLEVAPDGAPVDGGGKVSTELGMHLAIYRQRPDVKAIVHAHPPTATGFAVARIPLDGCVLPEVIVGLGAVPLAAYATPSTPEVAASIARLTQSSSAILLANHGVVTFGGDLLDAYFKMEKVEHAAQIILVARMLGGEHRLTAAEVDRLRSVSGRSYGKDLAGVVPCVPAENASRTRKAAKSAHASSRASRKPRSAKPRR